jgi:hypothetical protein
MPIRIDDFVHLEELKRNLAQSLDGIRTVFGEVTFGFLTVIDAHNKLETKLDAAEAKLTATEARLDGEIAAINLAMNLGKN